MTFLLRRRLIYLNILGMGACESNESNYVKLSDIARMSISVKDKKENAFIEEYGGAYVYEVLRSGDTEAIKFVCKALLLKCFSETPPPLLNFLSDLNFE